MRITLTTMFLSRIPKSPSWVVAGAGLFVMSINLGRLYIHLEVQLRRD